MATTFRADIVAGFGTMMNSYIAANPTLLKRHFRIRPEAFKDWPMSYLDLRPETVNYTSGTQVRTMTPTLVVVGTYTEAGETSDKFDVLVDSLVDFIGGYGGSFGGHITPTTVWSQLTITDGTEEDGDSRFPAVRLTFPDLSLVEGR